MKLRAADITDVDFVLMVRNDPDTRAASRTENPKDLAWYADRLADPAHSIFIAEIGDQAVGYGSLQAYTPTTAELGIAIAPAFRGLGLSHRLIDALIAKGSEQGIERFLATVRGQNVSSLRAFLHEGFMPSKWIYLERTK